MKALILCLLLLSGCSTLQPKTNIPASLMQKCQPLERLAGTNGEALIKNIVANAEVYHRCNDMHNALIEAVSEPKQ